MFCFLGLGKASAAPSSAWVGFRVQGSRLVVFGAWGFGLVVFVATRTAHTHMRCPLRLWFVV